MKTGYYLNRLHLKIKMLEEISNSLGRTVKSVDETVNGSTGMLLN